MSLKIRSRSEIDDIHWNRLLDASLQNVIYGYTWYLDAVCEDWVAIVDEGLYGYQLVMPIPIRRKWLMRVVYQPLFCQFLGIFSDRPIPIGSYADILALLSGHFAYISNYSFNPDNYQSLLPILLKNDSIRYWISNTYNLKLGRTYSNLSQNYSKDRKSNLKKCGKYYWEIVESKELTSIIALFVANHASRIEGGVSKNAYLKFENLCKEVSIYAELKIFHATIKNDPQAGIVLFVHQGKVIYIFNAANQIGREGNARSFLLDEFFKANAENDFTFDFESPDIESISKFYASFGAEKTPFLGIHQNKLRFPFNHLQYWRRRILTSN